MDKKICFVDLGAYPLIVGKNTGYAGGASVQQVLLADELVKHNYEIIFITYKDGISRIEDIGFIKVIKVYKREDSLKISLLKKSWHIWKSLREADADIYFHESGAPGIVSFFCFITGTKFVRYISSDAEVDENMAKYISKIGRLGNWLDIKLADIVIAQSDFQQRELKKKFGIRSYIVKNAFPLSDQKIPEKSNPPTVLWVSTIREIKEPELFLKLAEAIPDGVFQMVGGIDDTNPGLYNRIKNQAEAISNLKFLGFIPFHKIKDNFEKASIFVNTSKYEGFPNTFIQAWMHYVPVVSLNSDPDEIICKYKLAFHSSNFNQLVEDVRTLLNDIKLREHIGKNGKEYVETNHDIQKVVKKYIDIFENEL